MTFLSSAVLPLVLAPAAFLPQDGKAPAIDPAKQAALEASAAAIQADIEKLRGESFKQKVPVKLADKATLLDYLAKREALETSPEREAFKEQCAKLLGLVPASLDLKKATHQFLESQVGGFYDPPTKTFYIMDTFDGDLGRVIMSHELVHALDDQLYDLDGTAKKLGEDSDQTLAYWSVCEGSGTRTMTQWMMGNATKLDPASLMEFQKMGMAGMEDLPPFVWKPMLAAYTCGQTFVEKSTPKTKKPKAPKKDANGDKPLDASAPKEAAKDEAPAPTYSQQLAKAFRSPPRSTEQVLHPEKYWDEGQKDEPRRIAFDVTKLPAGWKVLGEDTLGEIGLALLTTPLAERKGIDANNLMALATLSYTGVASKGWGGDRLVLLGNGESRMLVLATVWDTEKDADEFRAAIEPIVAAQSFTGTWKKTVRAVLPRDEAKKDAVVLQLGWSANDDGVEKTVGWREAK